MSYMLITVCERDITTKQFDTFEKARSQMLNELAEEFFYANRFLDIYKNYLTKEELENDCDEKYVWDKIASLDSYMMTDDYYVDGYDFEFNKDWAWSNLDDDYYYDWKIIEVK